MIYQSLTLASLPGQLALAREAVLVQIGQVQTGRGREDLYLRLRMLLHAIELTAAACRVVAEEYQKLQPSAPAPPEGWPNE